MEEQKEQLQDWLDQQAMDLFGEFGFATCDEEQRIELVYHLVQGILHGQEVNNHTNAERITAYNKYVV